MSGHHDWNLLECRARAKKVLGRMSMTSEAAASRPSQGIRATASKSSPPPGAVLGHRKDLRDLSLYDYWHERFETAWYESGKLEAFVFLAERDLRRVTHRRVVRDETKEAREARILNEYAGLSNLEAALIEECSESYIRKVRKDHGYDERGE